MKIYNHKIGYVVEPNSFANILVKGSADYYINFYKGAIRFKPEMAVTNIIRFDEFICEDSNLYRILNFDEEK